MNEIPETERMILDFDGWHKSQPDGEREQLEGYLQNSPDRESAKRDIAARLTVSQLSGIAPQEVDSRWEMIRGGFAASRGWSETANDDGAFFEKLKGESLFHRDERQLVFGPDDDKAPDAEDKRKLSLVSQVQEAAFQGRPYAEAFSEWQGGSIVNKGWRADRTDTHIKVAKEVYEKMDAAVQKVRPIADEAFAKIKKAREGVTLGDNGGDSAPFALFRGLSGSEKDIAMRMMLEKSPYGDSKDPLDAFIESLGRGFENLGIGADDAMARRLRGMKFKEGDEVLGSDLRDHLDERRTVDSGDIFALLPQGDGRKLNAEEAAKWNADAANWAEDLDMASRLAKLGQQSIDPTDKTGGWVFKKMILPVADSGALLVSMSIPGMSIPAIGFAANQYSGEEYRRLEDAGMSSEEADRIAPVSGMAQAALDKLGFEVLGGIPIVKNTLAKFAFSASPVKRYAANFAATTLAETGIELLQDHIVPALAQDILATNPAFDVKWLGRDGVWMEAARAAPDTALGMVLISGAGAAIQTSGESRATRELASSKAAMTLSGYTDAQIELIQQSDAKEQGRLLAEFLPTKAPQGAEKAALIERFVKASNEELSVFNSRARADVGDASEALDYAVRVTRKGDGWNVTTADGKNIIVDSAEAARRIRDELKQASTVKEAQALVQVIDDWHAKADANTQRETALTGELVKSDGRTIEGFRDGEKVREITDAKTLETIRKEAQIDGEQTGNGDVNVVVNGANSHEFATRVSDGARVLIQRIELNKSASSYLTFLHESVESNWRAGLENGTFSGDETVKAIAAIAHAFDPASVTDAETKAFFERVQKVARGEANETELRETVSELAVSDILGKRKDGGAAKAGMVSAALSDAIRDVTDAADVKALGKLKAFVRAAKHYFRAVFAAVKAIRDAKRKDGKLAEDWEHFMDKLTGTDEQVAHDAAVADVVSSELKYDENGDPDWTMSLSVRKVDLRDDSEYKIAIDGIDSRLFTGTAKTQGTSIAREGALAAIESAKADLRASDGSGGSTESGTGSGGKSKSGKTEILTWAERAGRLIEKLPWRLDGPKDKGQGEHHVFLDDATGRWVKVTKGTGESFGKTLDLRGRKWSIGRATALEYLERLSVSNEVFGDDLTLHGVYRDKHGNVNIVTSQSGKPGQFVTREEIKSDMIEAGFSAIDSTSYYRAADNTLVLDLHEENAIQEDTETRFFDAMILRPTTAQLNALRGQMTFSISAGVRLEAVMKRADAALARDPDARRRVAKKANDALQKLQFDWETDRLTWRGDKIKPVVEPRTPESLTKEQAFREAMRREELEAEVYGVYGEVLDNEAMAQMWGAGPVMGMLARPGTKFQGKLISKSAALKSNKFNERKQGDYDGAHGIPRVVFGGSIMPDEMAHELFGMGLLKDDSAESLWDEIRKELKSAERWKGFLETAKADLKLARNKAHEEAAEWREERDKEQEKDWSPKSRLVRDLRTLDAILSALPPELRGKVGGFVKIATLSTDRARMAEIEKRIKRIGTLLEKHLQKESIEAVERLIEKAEPSSGPGEKPRGKITVEGHRVFAVVDAVWQMSKDDYANYSAALDKQIEDKISKGEDVIDLLEKQQVADMFGAFVEKNAAEMDKAASWLDGVYKTGRNAWRMIEESRLAEVAKLKDETVKAIGMASLAGTQKQKAEAAKLGKLAEGIGLNLLSFVQVLENVLGAKHPLVTRWNREARRATAQRTDGILASNGRFETMARAAFDGASKLEMSKRLWEMANNQRIKISKVEGGESETLSVPIETIAKWESGELTPADLGYTKAEADDLIAQLADPANAKKKNLEVERITPGVVTPAPLSELDAMALTMLARMEQYAPNLARHGYTEEAIREAEDGISDAGKIIRSHLLKEYADGYAPLARLFREMFGIDLPQIASYSPAAFMHAGDSQASDPFGGGMLPEGGFRAGFLKSRKEHLAAPSIQNALQTFLGHTAQIEHWKAFAPLVRELKAVFGSVEVKDAILSNRGQGTLNAAQGWVSAIEQNGLQQRAHLSALNPVWRYLTGRQATLTLAWKAGTILKQSMAAISSAARMPAGAWMRGFARVIGGKVDVKAIRASAMIQRRIESGYSPEVRAAMASIVNGKPSAWSEFVRNGMEKIGEVDAFFTAIGIAISHDYHLQQGLAAGLSEEAANAQALVEAEDILGRTGQPTELVDRSLVELGMSPMERVGFMFASNQRKDTALILSAWSQWRKGQITRGQFAQTMAVAWLYTGLGTALIGAAWRDATDDDDDEWLDWEHWNPIDFAKSVALGPLGGIPLLNMASNALQGYGPNDPLKPGVKAYKAIKTIGDGDKTEPVEKTVRRFTDIVNGAALLIPRAEAIAVTANILKQAFDLVDNFAPDTEDEATKKEKAAMRKAKKDAADN